MAVSFLALFLSPEEPIPVEIVRFFLKLLLHDSVLLRKVKIAHFASLLKYPNYFSSFFSHNFPDCYKMRRVYYENHQTQKCPRESRSIRD